MMFSEITSGPGAWLKVPPTVRQTWRDNAHTLGGQLNEQRQPFTRSDAASIRVPTLFVGGSDTPGDFSVVLRALAAHVPGARIEMISGAKHFMFENDPVGFCATVTKFLETG